MVLFALVLFIALIACWFALPGTTVSAETAGKETDPLKV